MKILCLHNVISWEPDDIDLKSNRISYIQFEELLNTIESEFDLCSFSQVGTMEGPKREQVCLTFDDGFAGVYENAMPILNKRGIDAACFISPRIFEQGFFYHFQELEAAMRIFQGHEVRVPWSGQMFSWRKDDEKARALKALKSELKLMREKDRKKFHQELIVALGVEQTLFASEIANSQRAKFLSLFHCQELLALGWTIGAHTLTHRTLSKLSFEEACVEISQSQKELSEFLGERVETFAYPYGDHAHISADISAYAASLFDKVFTTTKDKSGPRKTDIARWDIKPFMKEFFPQWQWNS